MRKTRSDAGRKHDKPEARLQVACVAWCGAADIFIDGSPGGAAFMKGAHTARGCRPGRADLLVLEAGADGTHGLAVELKIGKKCLQDSQVAWLARARCKGWRTGVARSLAEFKQIDHRLIARLIASSPHRLIASSPLASSPRHLIVA